MQDGNTMRNNYGCDLDSLTTGSRIGMMRSASGDLHYYINGVDQGVACSGLPPGTVELKPLLLLLLTPIFLNTTELTWLCVLCPAEVFAVIDLYGQCVQVSITTSSGPLDNSLCISNITEKSFPIQSPGRNAHRKSRNTSQGHENPIMINLNQSKLKKFIYYRINFVALHFHSGLIYIQSKVT